jgi:PPOX class probable F420-dependent enzyme
VFHENEVQGFLDEFLIPLGTRFAKRKITGSDLVATGWVFEDPNAKSLAIASEFLIGYWDIRDKRLPISGDAVDQLIRLRSTIGKDPTACASIFALCAALDSNPKEPVRHNIIAALELMTREGFSSPQLRDLSLRFVSKTLERSQRSGMMGEFHGARYLAMDTSSETGLDVQAPIRFAQEGNVLHVCTWSIAVNIKSICNTFRVWIAPCDRDGKVPGPWSEAWADICEGEGAAHGQELLSRKFGLSKIISDFFNRRRGHSPTVLAIRLE